MRVKMCSWNRSLAVPLLLALFYAISSPCGGFAPPSRFVHSGASGTSTYSCYGDHQRFDESLRLPLRAPRRLCTCVPTTVRASHGGVGDIFGKLKQAATSVALSRAITDEETQLAQIEMVTKLFADGKTTEAIKPLVRLCLNFSLSEGDVVKLWRRAALSAEAMASALKEGALDASASSDQMRTSSESLRVLKLAPVREAQQAYGLITGAKLLGMTLGHVGEAMGLLMTAHHLLTSSAASMNSSTAGAGDAGWAAGMLTGAPAEAGGTLQVGGSHLEQANASQSGTEEEIKRKGEDIILAVAEVSSAEAALWYHAGDYKRAYDKLNTPIALLTLLSQTYAPSSEGGAGVSRSGGEGASSASGASSGRYDERLAEEVVMQAAVARELGMYEEAALTCRRALLVLSLKHEITEPKPMSEKDKLLQVALMRAELGRVYLAKGAYEDALVEMRRVMHMTAEALGEGHPRTGEAMDQVALVMQAQGRYREAADLHRHALARREEYFGTESVQVATSLTHLANALQGAGEQKDALQLRERAVAMTRNSTRNQPAAPEEIGAALVSLAASQKALQLLEPAKASLRDAYQLLQAHYGHSHPKVAVVLGLLATVAEDEADYDKAILLHQQSLGIKKERLGEHHLAVSTTLVQMSRVHEKLGDLEVAVELRQHALQIVQARLGEEHPQAAVMLNNIAVIQARRSNYAQASELVQRALAIDEKAFGPQHPQVAADLNTLATLAFHCGEKQLSRQLYERALHIRRLALGDTHEKTLASKKNLDLVISQIEAED